MADATEEKLPPLEQGLMAAMQALDNQILREVSKRSPADREEHGVQNWEPVERRVENVCSFVLNLLGEDAVKLDSVLVLAQAFPKILQMAAGELGEEGMGKVRSNYSAETFRKITEDARRGLEALGGQRELN